VRAVVHGTVAAWLVSVLAASCIGLDPQEPPPSLECGRPSIAIDAWATVSTSDFSFRIPEAYARVQGTNRWQQGRAWVEYTLVGADSVLPEPEPLDDYAECRATVEGRQLFIQIGSTRSNSRFGRGFYLAANWGTIGQGPEAAVLLVEAWTPTQDRIQELLAILWTFQVRTTALTGAGRASGNRPGPPSSPGSGHPVDGGRPPPERLA
jgi:hypothetical protein